MDLELLAHPMIQHTVPSQYDGLIKLLPHKVYTQISE